MAKLKDISKAQVLYDALMIVTGGKKYQIRDICDSLMIDNVEITDQMHVICGQINSHLIEQGY
jgi:hypothetical protein